MARVPRRAGSAARHQPRARAPSPTGSRRPRRARLRCDPGLLVDVGGDVLAHGDEPGLASPLCDAVMLAAAALSHAAVASVGAVFGPGCDGELTPEELLERIAGLRRPAACSAPGTDAAMAVTSSSASCERCPPRRAPRRSRCARGEVGRARSAPAGGRSALSPSAPSPFFFDPSVAARRPGEAAAPVATSGSLRRRRRILTGLGMRSELAHEREPAGVGPGRSLAVRCSDLDRDRRP